MIYKTNAWFDRYPSSGRLTDKEKFVLSKFTEDEWVALIPMKDALNNHKITVSESLSFVFKGMIEERAK